VPHTGLEKFLKTSQ